MVDVEEKDSIYCTYIRYKNGPQKNWYTKHEVIVCDSYNNYYC